MNPAQIQFLQQNVAKIKSRPVPVRGVLSRVERERDEKETVLIQQEVDLIRQKLLEEPALATQLFQAVQGMPLPAFPISGV